MSCNKTLIMIILIGYITVSCIERYYLTEQSDLSSRIVVEALITDQDTIQKVILSRTSSPDHPKITPLTGCRVSVADINDNEYILNEQSEEPGVYEGAVHESSLYTGNKFRLNFITPSGDEYLSEYEELLPCPPVDSLYYEVQSIPTTDPAVTVDGVQFNLDFKAPEDYYRIQVDETWEYHSTWPITMYWAGKLYYNLLDFSLYTCYKTIPVDDIFVLSTTGFNENSYKKYRLHFVDDHTQRLLYKYSLLVKQYSLSEEAFYYWEELDRNSQESGGLLDRQPALVKSNVTNTRNPDEIVLGYFGVSSVRTRRFVFSDFKGLTFSDLIYCQARKLEERLSEYGPEEWPIYLVYFQDPVTEARVLGIANPDCFDCTLRGGTTEKPSYWDEK
jgi:hypothetical protein